jgi:hypothetical protein
MNARRAFGTFAAVAFILAATCAASSAQTWNAWPRDAGWGSVPFFGFGFNWRRSALPTPSYVLHPYPEVPEYVVSSDAVAYCSRRFRSYDPISGTYLSLDGVRRPCP